MTSTVPEIGENLVDFTDAQSMWVYLKRYEGSGPAQRIEAYNAWKDLQFNGRDLQVFTEKYQKTLRQMDNFNMALGHELRVYDLINRVAPFYSTWADIKRESLRKVTLAATAPADEHLPSIDSLTKDLLDQDAEMRRQDKNVNVTFKSPPSRSHQRKNTGKAALKCTHCHMTGHTEDKCYRKHGFPEGRGPNKHVKSTENTGAVGAVTANRGMTLAMREIPYTPTHFASRSLSAKDSWCFDSGAVYHITNDLNDFDEYTAVDSGVVVGDNRPLKGFAVGKATLPLVGIDGSITPVTFTDVLYVPQLSVKIISEQVLRAKHKVYYSGETFSLYKRTAAGGALHFATLQDIDGLPHLVIDSTHRKQFFVRAEPPAAETSVPCDSSDASDSECQAKVLLNSHKISSSAASAKDWHARLGHLSDRALQNLTVEGVTIVGSCDHGSCDACLQGKFKRKKSRVPVPRPAHVYDELSIDVVQSRHEGIGGVNWLTIATDGKSLYRHEFTHRLKSFAGEKIVHLLIHIENQTGRRVKRLRLDNGNEFATVKTYCEKNGILLMPTTAHNSSQNGRAEVSNYIVERTARTMMIAGKVPQHLWPYAVRTAVMLLNLTPSPALDYKSAIQLLEELGDDFKGPIHLGHLKAYGCRALVYDETKPRGDKFTSRVDVGKLVGYERGTHNIFYVYLPVRHKVVRTSNVVFEEPRFDTNDDDALVDEDEDSNGYIDPEEELYDPAPIASSGGDVGMEEPLVPIRPASYSEPQGVTEPEYIDTGMPDPGHRSSPPQTEDAVEPPTVDDEPPSTAPRRSSRPAQHSQKAQDNMDQGKTSFGRRSNVNLVRRLHQVYMTSVAGNVGLQPSSLSVKDIIIPKTYAEAMASSQSEEWLAAMEGEVRNLRSNSTWKSVHPMQTPHNANIIAGRWVFTIKADADGNPTRFKARWVARGFTQKHGVDYEDTYASVTKPATVKIMLALAAKLDLECKQFDLVTAFLNALIKKYEIYVEMPHGFEEYGTDGTQLVCLLQRALYGLKQSPLLWYEELTTFLRSIGCRPLRSDPCLFVHSATGTFILIYVDDLLLLAKSDATVDQIAGLLAKKFPMKELGDVTWFLGCRIIRDRSQRKVWIVQDAYIGRMAERFGVVLKKRLTPMKSGTELRKAPTDYAAKKKLRHQYQELVGSMMWPATITRGDIATTVSKLAMYLTNPTQDHFDAAVWCAEYLLHTKTEGLCLGGNDGQPTLQLEGYVDASWADNADDRRSTCGVLFKFGGGPVFWKSGRQSIVALSTTESEYIAMSVAAKEAAALRRLVSEILDEEQGAIVVHEDNQPAIDLLRKPPGADTRTKHMDVRYHYIRQEVDRGAIKVVKIPTEHQAADGLTKPLDRTKHANFKALFGLVDCQGLIRP